MNLNKEKGITIVALVITIIIMIILLGVGLYFGNDAVNKARLEDKKTDMLSIKTKVMIVADKYNFRDIENLIGIPLDEDQAQEGIQQNTYKVPEQLKTLLEEKNEDGTSKLDITKLYIWRQEDLNDEELGLGAIKVDTNRFYIIYYNLEDTNSCEIYSSEGYNGKYSLSDLKDM